MVLFMSRAVRRRLASTPTTTGMPKALHVLEEHGGAGAGGRRQGRSGADELVDGGELGDRVDKFAAS